MYARVASIAAVVVGIGLVVMTLSLSIFGRAAAGERITDRFRPTVATPGFNALATQYSELRGLGTQFVGKTLPDLSNELGVTPAQLQAKLDKDFPATARAVRDVPPAIRLVDPVIPRLVGVRSDFRKIDHIPGLGLPITVIGPALLLIGAVLSGLGIAGLLGKGWAMGGLVGTGIAMVVIPLALGLPGKLAAGPHVVDVGKVSLSQKAADTATRTVGDVDALVPEVQYSLIPWLAAKTHQTPLALTRTLTAKYPAVMRGLRDWPHVREGAVALAANQEASVGDQKLLQGTPFKVLTWVVVVPGALLAIVAGLALAPRRRRADAPVALGTS